MLPFDIQSFILCCSLLQSVFRVSFSQSTKALCRYEETQDARSFAEQLRAICYSSLSGFESSATDDVLRNVSGLCVFCNSNILINLVSGATHLGNHKVQNVGSLCCFVISIGIWCALVWYWRKASRLLFSSSCTFPVYPGFWFGTPLPLPHSLINFVKERFSRKSARGRLIKVCVLQHLLLSFPSFLFDDCH